MAAKRHKTFTLDEKAAILAELASASITATAKKHRVSQNSIYAWKKAAGMNGGGKVGAKKKARKLGKKARRSSSNGHVSNPSPAAGLDHLHEQLSAALASVTAMREAFSNVFGGGA